MCIPSIHCCVYAIMTCLQAYILCTTPTIWHYHPYTFVKMYIHLLCPLKRTNDNCLYTSIHICMYVHTSHINTSQEILHHIITLLLSSIKICPCTCSSSNVCTCYSGLKLRKQVCIMRGHSKLSINSFSFGSKYKLHVWYTSKLGHKIKG